MKYEKLTTPQKNIWNLQKYYENTAISNLCGAIFYREERDISILRQAVSQFIHNQTAMRIRFCEKDEPLQYVDEELNADIPFKTFNTMDEFDDYAREFAKVPLGLTKGQMYRFEVFQVKNTSGILVVSSHLISDAWTFGLMAKQIDNAYFKLSGDENISLIEADYRDYIHSEEEYFKSARYTKDKIYWEQRYTCRPEESLIKVCQVPTKSITSNRITRTLPLPLDKQIDTYCKINTVTQAVLFEAALFIYLSKINQENNAITIGVPVLNRSNAKEKNIAGMFVSTMPLTVDITGETIIVELLKAITTGHVDIFRHQKYPYADILKYLREKQNFSGNLYDVMISYQNAKTNSNAETKWYSNGYCEVPLELHIDNRDGLESHTINVDYQTDVFKSPEEVEYIIKRLEYVLWQITTGDCDTVNDIKIVPEKELDRIICDFNNTYIDYPRDKCVHELFSEQANMTPSKVAIVFEDKRFTYRELDEMSNSLAHFLRDKGVKPNDVVPIIARRSWHVIVAMLGVLKAGGAYMPVAPDYPQDRIEYMIGIAESKLALVYGYYEKLDIESVDLGKFDYGMNTSLVTGVNKSDDLCYVIFTSGSTGNPKGVTLCHRNVVNYSNDNNKNMVHHALIGNQYKNIVSVTNIVFDIFVTESLFPLVNGMTVYFASDKEVVMQTKLSNLIENSSIEVMQTTPTKMRSYILDKSNIGYLRKLKAIILGGEAFPLDLYNEIKGYTDADIYNIYGPAETTVWSTNAEVTDNNITIGKPISNTQIYILDKDGNPLPIGVSGELCIAGDGVGKGYLNRPELTAERFVPNPFVTDDNRHGKVMYHTGDLARWRADGEIEYLGRIDTQVKIRGLRIELGEIESVMSSMEGIGLTAVADKRDENNRQYLVGYYTSETVIDEKKLREHLSAKLPKYMVPNYFMHLDAMPMTPSGKTDRKNLPIPDFTSQTVEYVEPVTETELRLADIWKRLLSMEKVGRNDDFFENGGDSLLAISMLNEIEKKFNVEMSINDIMEHTMLVSLSVCIEQAHGTSHIVAYHDKKYVLLPQQKTIYAVCSKNPDTLTYNMPAKIELPKDIDKNRLKQSIEKVVKHHKLLNSHIQIEENDVYGVYDEDVCIAFEEYNHGDEYRFVRAFDLEKSPLVHVGFTGDALLFDMHHIVADGEALNIIIRDIMSVYEGKELTDSVLEYGDYARYFYGLDMSEHKDYFKNMLKCDFEPIVLPDTTKPEKGGKSKLYTIPQEIFTNVKDMARKATLTDTMIFLGAYGILLSKYTAMKDILSSIILQNRSHTDTKDMVGMFVNTLPVHLAIKEALSEYMQDMKQLVLNLYRYQELPFGEIANAVGMEDKSVINTSFVYQADGEKTLNLNGTQLTPKLIDTHTSKFDLTMELTPLESGCKIRMEYNCEKYDEQLIDELAGAYIRILTQLDKAKIADICVLSEQERIRIVEKFNDTYADYPRDKCVHELFSEQANKTPDKAALVFEDKRFTYRELDEMSNSLAHFLREKGVKPNDVVPIIARRSWHVIVAMLGVLKAGGAYMIVDYQYPQQRIRYLVNECRAKFTLVYGCRYDGGVDLSVLCNYDYHTRIDNVNSIDDVFCVIHTSGSTGVPKVTALTHENILHYIDYSKQLFKDAKQVISTTISTFDAFIQETIVALCQSVPIVLLNENEITNQSLFENKVMMYNDSFLFQTPTKLISYIRNSTSAHFLNNMKSFVLGGEVFTQELFDKIRNINKECRIYNIYGPIETTVCISVKKLIQDEDITIGKPIANTQIYILDKDGTPLPIGVAGELCIAGDGVGKGYLNRPELTAERFVPNPFVTDENRHGKVMYHTGDLARWRADGEIEYLGRIDTQVKIRGLRIELGEIESVMSSMEGIGLTAVADKRDENNRQYLVGYYTSETVIDEKKLREHLSAKLPKYMVPNYFMHLDVMPMTPSGKTDRKNLPIPDFTLQTTEEYVAPETEIEIRLANIWEKLLSTEKVGRNDDFFELGGDSLLAINMLSEIENVFHMEISMKNIMEQTKLEQLANCIEQSHEVSRIKAYNDNKYVLLPQQKAIYAVCSKNPDTLMYNMPTKINLPEDIDKERLKHSILTAFENHKLLKSYIQVDENEIYGVYDENASIVFEEYSNGDERKFVRPFNLEKAPLVRIGFTENFVLFDIHHIIADGDSINIILRDIVSVYNGKMLQKSVVEYSDYSKYFYGLDIKRHSEYFKNMLKCDFEPIELPETKNVSCGGMSKLYDIPGYIFEKVKVIAKKNGLTDTMVFLGAYGLLLSKYTAKKDIFSSIILQNRIHADTKDMVGMFVNTLPVHIQISERLSEYMQGIKQLMLDLFQYQEMPFWNIANAVGLHDKSAVNTSFIYQGDGEKKLILNEQQLKPQALYTDTAKFDLSMELTPLESGCKIRMEYNCEKYDEGLADKLIKGYIQILTQLDKEKTADISVLSPDEYTAIVEEFNNTYIDYPRDKCVHELFSEQANMTPDKAALVFEDKRFTYRELDEMSNSLAHFLRDNGVKPNDVVPIIARRSWHVIVAMLGVLKSGGAYMPVAPDYPQDRMEYMIGIAESKLALVYGYYEKLDIESVDLGNFDYGTNTGSIAGVNTSDDLCYVIFTSGSTGNPKGVLIAHRNVVNYCDSNSFNVRFKIIKNQYRSIISVTNIVFDIFVTESLFPLINGMTVYFASDKEVVMQTKLSNLIENNSIEVMQTTPTKMRSYILDKSNIGYLRKLKAIILGGEAFPLDLYNELKGYTDADIYNIYGPAETTVWSTNAEVTDNNITIGNPIANTQIYILDKDGTPLPIGVAGELCIAGDGVGKGYLNRPELTAERFVPNPFATDDNRHGKVMYHTGDLARWRADGEIEYLGRIDTQVKIRGLRIELGEIESVMSSMEGIGLTAVADKRDENNRQYLVGYYTSETVIDEKKLREHLSAKLPKYMVPNYFMHLDAMPMTPSGKTDRKSLPIPDFTSQTIEYVEPVTETQRKLCALLEELLHMEKYGINNDFFEYGGDSLTAIEYVAKAHVIGIDFDLQNVFDYPTVSELTYFIESGNKEHIKYQDSDFDKYARIFECNIIDNSFIPIKRSLGNVLLTGATGFLGAHVLDELMRNESGKLYCLVRSGNMDDRRGKIHEILKYYFGNKYEPEFGKRIIPIVGDIENESLSDEMPKDVQTVIHTAASVKHYGSYNYFNRVNVEGTRHVVNYARLVGAKLIHISTLSVSGNSMADDFTVYRSDEEKYFYETSLYIGQPLDNVYIHSKFEAEKAVYDAMLDGLDAKVIRVGNLTNRVSDYKFQPNYKENAFLTRAKSILEFGLFPDYLLPLYSEFSPIDLTAEGIVKIAQYADKQCIFHLYSNKPIYFDRFLEIMHELGIPMRVVAGTEFNKALDKTAKDNATEYIYEAFQNDMDEQGRLVYDSNIHIINDFTVWFMKKVGFEWNETDSEYIKGYIDYFRRLGYLEV